MSPSLLKIVLTGAPGSGKTTAVRTLGEADTWRDWRGRLGGVTVVHEAATHIYSTQNTRWDRLDLDGRCEAQRAIYRHQIQQERDAEAQARALGHSLVLLDRGTLDGAVYWPSGPEAYWNDLQTSEAEQLGRYHGVLLLESTAALEGVYDGDASNATRFEDAASALENAKALAGLWTRHGMTGEVRAARELDVKLAAIAVAVESMAKDLRDAGDLRRS